MNTMSSSRFAPSLWILWIGLCLLPQTARADRTISERFDAQPDGVLEVSVISGSIVVRGWDRSEIRVEGTVGSDVEELRVKGTGSRTRITLETPHKRNRDDVSAHLKIHVPRGTTVEISVVNARVDVDEVNGPVDLHSVNGTIEVHGSPRNVSIETVNGAVFFDGETDRLNTETVNGRLNLAGRARDVEVSMVSGGVDLQTDGIERLELDAVSCSFKIDTDLAPGAEINASSHSGSILLRLAANASARIRASTFSGGIVNKLGPAAKRQKYGSGQDLDFTLGDGDGRIDLNAFSGSIRIEER